MIGQIELYTHFPIMRQFVHFLQRMDYRVCGVYVLDSQFIQDPSKFFSGILSATSAMIQLEIPHINVLSKVDLLGEFAQSHEFERYFLNFKC
jgi:GTPase SAR1 family protein